MSKIEPLGKLQWSAHAALASAMEDIDPEQAVLVLWADGDGSIRHRAAHLTNKDVLWMLEKKKRELLD